MTNTLTAPWSTGIFKSVYCSYAARHNPMSGQSPRATSSAQQRDYWVFFKHSLQSRSSLSCSAFRQSRGTEERLFSCRANIHSLKRNVIPSSCLAISQDFAAGFNYWPAASNGFIYGQMLLSYSPSGFQPLTLQQSRHCAKSSRQQWYFLANVDPVSVAGAGTDRSFLECRTDHLETSLTQAVHLFLQNATHCLVLHPSGTPNTSCFCQFVTMGFMVYIKDAWGPKSTATFNKDYMLRLTVLTDGSRLQFCNHILKERILCCLLEQQRCQVQSAKAVSLLWPTMLQIRMLLQRNKRIFIQAAQLL